jgi:hypothetical protein
MTQFDFIVLALLLFSAIVGFMRGRRARGVRRWPPW